MTLPTAITSEIVNLDCIDGFEGRSALPLCLSKNCYYIGKNPLYATSDYRQRMEGVFVKAAIKRGQKSLLILPSVSSLGRRPRRSSSDLNARKSRPGVLSRGLPSGVVASCFGHGM